MFKLRFDDAGRKVWMLPQDVIDQTINAFSVSATSANGYAGAAPTGRYFAPANGPDCIEIDNGADYGACAARSIVVTGPMFRQFDLRFSKRIRLVGPHRLRDGGRDAERVQPGELRPGGHRLGRARSATRSRATK